MEQAPNTKKGGSYHHYAYAVAIVLGLGLLGYFLSPARQGGTPQTEATVATSTAATTTSAAVAEIISRENVENIPKVEAIVHARPTTVPSTPVGFSVSEIVGGWQNRVAEVFCTTEGGQDSGGAATLITTARGLVAVTNDHVIDDGKGGAPDWCGVGIYGLGARIIEYGPGRFTSGASKGLDLGFITLSNPNYSNDEGTFDTVASSYVPVCSESEVQIGDEIVILGYPWNGSQSSVTATRGLVSGYDGIYYVTDAKIEHGNSGGAAILMKKNCWLGIPTAVVAGRLESYGRILKGEYAIQ